MSDDAFRFSISFPVDGIRWRVHCCVMLSIESLMGGDFDTKVGTIRIASAVHDNVKLDEVSWRELLKDNALLRPFCSDMMGYASLLEWSISRPAVME